MLVNIQNGFANMNGAKARVSAEKKITENAEARLKQA